MILFFGQLLLLTMSFNAIIVLQRFWISVVYSQDEAPRMAQIYGTIGSLSQLLFQLKEHNITFLDSLEDIISFNNNFENRLLRVKEETKGHLLKEKLDLKEKLIKITAEYGARVKEREDSLGAEKNGIDALINRYSIAKDDFFIRPFKFYKRYTLNKRKHILFTQFEEEVQRPLKNMNRLISSTKQKLQYTEEFFDTILEDRSRANSKHLYTAKRIIDENDLTLMGAIGEQKALDELKKLPNTYIIINDFRYEFKRALHKKNTNDWIRSIQADHLIIGPSGVFVVETKNWSNNSIQSLDLYSPVQQVQRTSYAIFMLLNKIVANGFSRLNHHWGAIQVPVKTIILMINKKPTQEFQHVKILALDEICNYIRYWKPVFAHDEVHEIANILLSIYY